LLQAFGAMCSLEVRVITELLYSVLPLELARDIQNDLSGECALSLSHEDFSLVAKHFTYIAVIHICFIACLAVCFLSHVKQM